VKIHAVTSSVTVAKLLANGELVKEEIIPAFKAAIDSKLSWRLRFALADMGALVAEFMSQASVDSEMVPIYESLLLDREPEVRSESIDKLPTLCKYASSNAILEKIVPIIVANTVTD